MLFSPTLVSEASIRQLLKRRDYWTELYSQYDEETLEHLHQQQIKWQQDAEKSRENSSKTLEILKYDEL